MSNSEDEQPYKMEEHVGIIMPTGRQSSTADSSMVDTGADDVPLENDMSDGQVWPVNIWDAGMSGLVVLIFQATLNGMLVVRHWNLKLTIMHTGLASVIAGMPILQLDSF